MSYLFFTLSAVFIIWMEWSRDPKNVYRKPGDGIVPGMFVAGVLTAFVWSLSYLLS